MSSAVCQAAWVWWSCHVWCWQWPGLFAAATCSPSCRQHWDLEEVNNISKIECFSQSSTVWPSLSWLSRLLQCTVCLVCHAQEETSGSVLTIQNLCQYFDGNVFDLLMPGMCSCRSTAEDTFIFQAVWHPMVLVPQPWFVCRWQRSTTSWVGL